MQDKRKWEYVGNTDEKGYGGGFGNGQYTSPVSGGGVEGTDITPYLMEQWRRRQALQRRNQKAK